MESEIIDYLAASGYFLQSPNHYVTSWGPLISRTCVHLDRLDPGETHAAPRDAGQRFGSPTSEVVSHKWLHSDHITDILDHNFACKSNPEHASCSKHPTSASHTLIV